MSNRKHPLYKEMLRVQNELSELEKIMYNQNWIELEKPYKNGYWMSLDLREDIKNREDAWIFHQCLNLIGQTIWSRSKDFKTKITKGQYKFEYPGRAEISDSAYQNLSPAVKKHFTELKWYHPHWNPYRKSYSCIIPSYYFVYKVKACWTTHYKEHDCVIKQQIAEKRALLYGKYYELYMSSDTRRRGLSSYVEAHNRSDRKYNKQKLKKNIKLGVEYDTYEFRYNHKHSALWEYW